MIKLLQIISISYIIKVYCKNDYATGKKICLFSHNELQ